MSGGSVNVYVVDSGEDFDNWEGPSKGEGGTAEYEPHCEDEDFNVSSSALQRLQCK